MLTIMRQSLLDESWLLAEQKNQFGDDVQIRGIWTNF